MAQLSARLASRSTAPREPRDSTHRSGTFVCLGAGARSLGRTARCRRHERALTLQRTEGGQRPGSQPRAARVGRARRSPPSHPPEPTPNIPTEGKDRCECGNGNSHHHERPIDFLGEPCQAILPGLADGDQFLVAIGPDRLQHDGKLKGSKLPAAGMEVASMRSRNLARGSRCCR